MTQGRFMDAKNYKNLSPKMFDFSNTFRNCKICNFVLPKKTC